MQCTETLDIPDDVYGLIMRRARQSGRTFAQQVAQTLVQYADEERREADLIDDIRSGRDEMARKGVFITADEIAAVIARGRGR